MKTQIIERVPPSRGILRLRGRNRKNEVVFDTAEENLIVSSARSTLARLIGEGETSRRMKYIVLGNDPSTPSPDNESIGRILAPSIVPGVNKKDEVLVAYALSIGAHTYPEEGHVAFHFTVSYGDANGLNICELGLMSENGTLFSRKTRGVIEKDEELAIDGTWTIIF